MSEKPNMRAHRTSANNTSNGDDELTQLLRLGDPATGDSELSPVEVAGMRRTIIEAAEQARPTRGLWPLLAAGLRLPTPVAALATVSAVVLTVWLTWSLATPPAPVAEQPAPEVAAAAPPAERASRTVQFTSPSGTRIIWTLDPNFESPIAAPQARQE